MWQFKNLNLFLSLSAVSLITALTFSARASEQAPEKITVVGKTPEYLKSLDGILPVTLIDTQGVGYTSSLADVFSLAPEVSYNGQGGLLQTISIRGLSRWRIQTLVEGIPIHTERRAGNAAEFIAPGLVGDAYVLSGAASTQLGSGALGGGIDLQLATSSQTRLNGTNSFVQNYRNVQVLGGQESQDRALYWGGSFRHANNGEDSLNQTLLNGFEQSVGWIRHVSDDTAIEDALLIVSKANNVGKANADSLDDRRTIYPDNDHWLAKLNFDWMNARLYAHNARLDTQIIRENRRTNYLQNRSLGWGASIGNEFAANDWQFNWQLAVDARSGVEATEQEVTPSNEPVFERTNLIGSQQAWSAVLNSTRYWHAWEFAAGARFEHMRQTSSADIPQSLDETSVSGFVGAKKRWSEHWTSGVYLSHGYRVPTLTERFFSGSTPRGLTQGDAGLRPEQAKNLQADLEYRGEHISVSVSAFHQSIDHYIERVTLTPTLQQYTALEGATIDGASYSAYWALSPTLNLRVQGQWLWAEDDLGMPVNDVSPHQHDARLGWQFDTQAFWLNIVYRQAHDDPGSSELKTNSVVHFRAGYEKELSAALTASIFINNITNKNFPVSTDDLAANAQGRDIELNLAYVF